MAVHVVVGDCRTRLAELTDCSVQMCVTSPPYFGLRDYGVGGQIGLEATPDAFVAELVTVFREVRRVLKDDGTLWLNLGDSYAGSGKGPSRSLSAEGRDMTHTAHSAIVPDGLKPKDLIGIPWRVAFALQADGWYLRSDIIWHKPNPMPESVTDRPTKSHEYLFLLSKNERYYYDAEAIAEPVAPSQIGRVREDVIGGTTRNKRTVWTVNTQPFKEAHFATFPPALIEPCILAGTKRGDTVLDPFGGAGTTGLVADRLGRSAILCELNPAYAEMAIRRVRGDNPLFVDVSAA